MIEQFLIEVDLAPYSVAVAGRTDHRLGHRRDLYSRSRRRGKRVGAEIVTKERNLQESNTYYAQGGVAAAARTRPTIP